MYDYISAIIGDIEHLVRSMALSHSWNYNVNSVHQTWLSMLLLS